VPRLPTASSSKAAPCGCRAPGKLLAVRGGRQRVNERPGGCPLPARDRRLVVSRPGPLSGSRPRNMNDRDGREAEWHDPADSGRSAPKADPLVEPHLPSMHPPERGADREQLEGACQRGALPARLPAAPPPPLSRTATPRRPPRAASTSRRTAPSSPKSLRVRACGAAGKPATAAAAPVTMIKLVVIVPAPRPWPPGRSRRPPRAAG